MKDNRFDALARALNGRGTRRRALGAFAAAAMAGMAHPFGSPSGEAIRRDRKRKRKHARRERRDRPALGCPKDTRRCDGECIPIGECCPDDCSGGQTCQQEGCACPDDKPKPCGEACIPADQCCPLTDCSGGRICDEQGGCSCPETTKPCDDECIPGDACCGGCPGATTCKDGACRGTGEPLYPDLRTLPAKDLRFDRLDDGTHVLRFANTIWNAGEGRLELEGDPRPKNDVAKKIFQNVYDDPVGGTLVSQRQVASDLIYHPGHNHIHFANFASYLLLALDRDGNYQPTTKKGTKTSFCIEDTDRLQGGFSAQYASCGLEVQGLTPGWGDTYGAQLADQWIVLGSQPLADGHYAVKSTADPKGLLDEGGNGRETNNSAVTYFRVRNGRIEDVRVNP